jgi:5-methylcytosine-specific restriction endonuclease McrA
MALTKKQRQQVWGKSGGKCWYCGGDLPEKGWHADHLEPIKREVGPVTRGPRLSSTDFGPVPDHIQKLLDDGMAHPERDRVENMVPACAPCNLFKSTYSIEGFRREIGEQVERVRRGSVNFRTAERFGLVEATGVPVVFWFEEQGLS